MGSNQPCTDMPIRSGLPMAAALNEYLWKQPLATGNAAIVGGYHARNNPFVLIGDTLNVAVQQGMLLYKDGWA